MAAMLSRPQCVKLPGLNSFRPVWFMNASVNCAIIGSGNGLAPNHYLNQCWLIVHRKVNRRNISYHIWYHKGAFENYSFEMTFFRGQWVGYEFMFNCHNCSELENYWHHEDLWNTDFWKSQFFYLVLSFIHIGLISNSWKRARTGTEFFIESVCARLTWA